MLTTTYYYHFADHCKQKRERERMIPWVEYVNESHDSSVLARQILAMFVAEKGVWHPISDGGYNNRQRYEVNENCQASSNIGCELLLTVLLSSLKPRRTPLFTQKLALILLTVLRSLISLFEVRGHGNIVCLLTMHPYVPLWDNKGNIYYWKLPFARIDEWKVS